jgi:hypothetical protein
MRLSKLKTRKSVKSKSSGPGFPMVPRLDGNKKGAAAVAQLWLAKGRTAQGTRKNPKAF